MYQSVTAFKFLLLLSVLGLSFTCAAQEYKVVSFEIVPNDITARTNPRVDLNGRKCAMIKVFVQDRIDHANGSAVGDIVYKGGMEKWVYIAHDSKNVELVFDNHLPIYIRFDDYNVPVLTEQTVYVLKLTDEVHAGSWSAEEVPHVDNIEKPQLSATDIYNKAVAAYKEGKYSDAFSLFSEIPNEKGAQNYLGYMYATGKSVTQDYKKAVIWFRKAAAQGSDYAQDYLGNMYESGRGVDRDYGEAVRWYRKAAKQGAARAQCDLGYMYENGRGVSRDYGEAMRWYQKAADQGFARGQNNLGLMYENGRGVKRDYGKAILWYRKASDQGYAWGQYNLGNMYYAGLGISKDYSEAMRLFRKSADQGNSKAQFMLGFMYANGEGVRQDYKEAGYWYQKAAVQGNVQAQCNLGLMYHNGTGVVKDLDEARRWYERAAAQGSSTAKDNLKKLQ